MPTFTNENTKNYPIQFQFFTGSTLCSRFSGFVLKAVHILNDDDVVATDHNQAGVLAHQHLSNLLTSYSSIPLEIPIDAHVSKTSF